MTLWAVVALVWISFIGIGVLLLWCLCHSRKFCELEKRMSRLLVAIAAIEVFVSGLQGEIATLRDQSTGSLSQADQDALADRLESLIPKEVPSADDSNEQAIGETQAAADAAPSDENQPATDASPPGDSAPSTPQE